VPPDLAAAAAFAAGHARLLDRHRFTLLFSDGRPEPVLAALEAYRNADGGYGWGLEPDLRSTTSQPAGALHALEVFGDVAPACSPRARELCDWLDAVTLPDGGVPFALPVPDPAACAPFWATADPTTSSLQLTAVVAAAGLRVAAHDPAVAASPWLGRAVAATLDRVRALDTAPPAMELAFVVQFLDAAHAVDPAGAAAALDRVRGYVPAEGRLHVDGGAAEEFMRPLDFAPRPGPARELLDPAAVAEDLRALAAEQQPDGGWLVDFASYSPAATLEWRGYRTVAALALLRDNGLG
jgi:hypothetical protein